MSNMSIDSYVKMNMIASCSCLTKTPDLRYHKEWCVCRKLETAIEGFETWFLAIPGADRNSLNKNKDGVYVDVTATLSFMAYCAGIKHT